MSAAVTSDAHVTTSSLGRQALTIGRASGFFLIATSAIALHIVDDNYLQPKPGTSAGDHPRERTHSDRGAGSRRRGPATPTPRPGPIVTVVSRG